MVHPAAQLGALSVRYHTSENLVYGNQEVLVEGQLAVLLGSTRNLAVHLGAHLGVHLGTLIILLKPLLVNTGIVITALFAYICWWKVLDTHVTLSVSITGWPLEMMDPVTISQAQWAELMETLWTAAQRAEQWLKEQEGLAAMLGEAREALRGAKEDAQAADQRSRELMGLYGWAGATPGSSGGTKVEIFQDPRSYDSSASKFEEWWTKINTWLECHPKQFVEKDRNGNEVPALKPHMYTVLSWLKGTKGAHYAEMELKKLADGKSLHRYWELFAMEIEGLFHPLLQQDWARQALKKLRQTDNMSTVAFITEFMKLKYYAKTDNHEAIGLLEDNVHPRIRYQLFSTGRRATDYNATLIAIKEIGTNLEAYCMYARTGQEAGPSKNIHQLDSTEMGPGPDPDTDIGALSWNDKPKKGRTPMPQSNKCFNCGNEGHGIKDCKKPKNPCGECKFHGGGHQRDCSKYVAKVRATSNEQATAHAAPSVAGDPFAAICSMDFKQMQAYFWDKKDIAEKSGKGKAQ